jgi:chromate reductase
VLESLKARLAEGGKAELDLFPLHDIPLYNSDNDGDASPNAVKALRQAIEDAKGLLICSPEYNHGISGVLKNALDWASRPAFNSSLKGKAALIMTASPAATGGVRAQYQTREALVSCLCNVVLTPEIVIPTVFDKFTDGVFTDEATLKFTEDAIDTMIAAIK